MTLACTDQWAEIGTSQDVPKLQCRDHCGTNMFLNASCSAAFLALRLALPETNLPIGRQVVTAAAMSLALSRAKLRAKDSQTILMV